jgi:8-oxo-dGTP diphosphatase
LFGIGLHPVLKIFRIAKPDKPKIHLVSYFVVIDPLTNELLLTDHKKSGLWLPPGGHVEIDEHPADTVKREIQEELGIEAQFLLKDPLFVTVIDTVGNVARHTDVSLWYVLRGDKNGFIKFDLEEFHKVQWFRSNDVPYSHSDPHMRRFVAKVMNKITTLNSYNASASQYAQNTSNLHPEEEATKFIKLLPAQAKIIDIGCGPGRDAKVFSNHGFDLIGIDFSSKMIEAARKNVPHSTFLVMDIETLVFPPESFDGVWASSA